jgi:actin-related protein 9
MCLLLLFSPALVRCLSFLVHRTHVSRRLGIKRAQNESPALISIFNGLSRAEHQRISQIFFERLNYAALSILERPVAQLYAANVLTGVVVDLNRSHTDITPIYECIPQHAARVTLPVGTDDCERYLASLLKNNTSVTAALAPEAAAGSGSLDRALVRLARQIWRAGLVKVGDVAAEPDTTEEGITDIAAVVVAGREKAVIEANARKKANAKASAAELARAREIEALDLVTITFEGRELAVGKERHRFCEPLFQPTLLSGLEEGTSDEIVTYSERIRRAKTPSKTPPLHELVGHAVGLTEVDQRQYIYQGLFFAGAATEQIKGRSNILTPYQCKPLKHVLGLGSALKTRLAPFVLGNPEQQNEVQPRTINILKVPEYFAEFRETGDGYAAFLGSSIVAKVSYYRYFCAYAHPARFPGHLQRYSEQEFCLQGRLCFQGTKGDYRNVCRVVIGQ